MNIIFDRIKKLTESRNELAQELTQPNDRNPFMQNVAENIIAQLNERIDELQKELEDEDPFLQYLKENAHRINPTAHLGDTQ